MSDNTYNGWTNYETWVVKLWIDNEQGSQEYWQERAESLAADTDTDDDLETRKDAAASALADELESAHDEAMPEVTGVFADLMGRALGMVNWHEIARAIIDDLDDAFPVDEAA